MVREHVGRLAYLRVQNSRIRGLPFDQSNVLCPPNHPESPYHLPKPASSIKLTSTRPRHTEKLFPRNQKPETRTPATPELDNVPESNDD